MHFRRPLSGGCWPRALDVTMLTTRGFAGVPSMDSRQHQCLEYVDGWHVYAKILLLMQNEMGSSPI
eukprot:scaffold297492_cov52-Prasinocladus_malaysianus.AAC.2